MEVLIAPVVLGDTIRTTGENIEIDGMAGDVAVCVRLTAALVQTLKGSDGEILSLRPTIEHLATNALAVGRFERTRDHLAGSGERLLVQLDLDVIHG